MSTISKSVLAVILGGGAGSRLFPLTVSRSKPAVPIAGKYRLVDIPISNCINSHINRMFVLTQFNSASLNKHIKNTYHFSAFSSGFVDILAAEQTPDNPGWFQGTADAVRQSLRHISNLDFDYILILSGDQLYQMDFSDMWQAHIAKGADISIATIPVDSRDAPEFGILKTNDENLITSFIEKPSPDVLPDWTSDTGAAMVSAGKNYLASMGIYIFSKKALYHLLNQVHPNATDFGKEIMPQAIDSYNIGLTDDVPKFNLFDNAKTVYSRARMLPPAKISGTRLNKSIIAEGSIILADVIDQSVVGIRARIGSGTTITNAYVMGNDYYETLEQIHENTAVGNPLIGIGERCVIESAIIDKNCRIGNDVIIKGGKHLANTDHPLYAVKDGIVVIKKRAVLANGFVIQ